MRVFSKWDIKGLILFITSYLDENRSFLDDFREKNISLSQSF